MKDKFTEITYIAKDNKSEVVVADQCISLYTKGVFDRTLDFNEFEKWLSENGHQPLNSREYFQIKTYCGL